MRQCELDDINTSTSVLFFESLLVSKRHRTISDQPRLMLQKSTETPGRHRVQRSFQSIMTSHLQGPRLQCNVPRISCGIAYHKRYCCNSEVSELGYTHLTRPVQTICRWRTFRKTSQSPFQIIFYSYAWSPLWSVHAP